MRVLVTAFEPFDGDTINSSLEVAHALRPTAEVELVTAELPVVWDRARDAIRERIERVDPDAVVALGQTSGGVIGVERIAVNLDDPKVDNAGVTADDEPIVVDAPPAYWSTLPVREIVEALRAHDIPAVVSRDAGGYLCNHLFYGLMHVLASRPRTIGGFVHVPPLPTQVLCGGGPSLPLETSLRAIELVLQMTVRTSASPTAEHAV